MKHSEKEVLQLKEEVKLMWKLVIAQVDNAKKTLLYNDLVLASEIINREIDVNTFELKIDTHCENFIALYSPVAIDLRLALSLIKISSELERISDFTKGIAQFVIHKECEIMDTQLLVDLKIEKMFDILIGMLLDGYVAFETEQTKVSERIIANDMQVDEIYHNVFNVLADYMKTHPERSICLLKMMLLVRKLERIGDHNKNIIEEIVFFVEAKVLKHSGKAME
ncbi:MAG: phosphate signaling complex protein PhoU [Bacteroidia bacterium]|nr:phosphate signaling complex protein PhoU [Bacteroidia bacterium]MCO5253489.1 phosphate signaling complex protein PhoU [Bacteroidota bacterium]